MFTAAIRPFLVDGCGWLLIIPRSLIEGFERYRLIAATIRPQVAETLCRLQLVCITIQTKTEGLASSHLIMIMFGSSLPSALGWLVTTKVYSRTGADIVMESITLTTVVGADGENPVASDELVVAHKPKAFTCSSVS